MRSTGRRSNITSRQSRRFPSVDVARNIEDLPSGCERWSPPRIGRELSLEALQRRLSLLGRDGPRDLRSDRRDRPRDAMGLCAQVRAFRAVGCARFRGNLRRAWSGRAGPPRKHRTHAPAGAEAFYKYEGPRTRYFDLIYAGYSELEPRPGIRISGDPQALA